MALHDMQGRVEASKLGMFDQCINALSAKDAEIAALRAKLARAVEAAFKDGLRHSINVKISDEHDVQTAWDWSRLKYATLADLATDTGGGKEGG